MWTTALIGLNFQVIWYMYPKFWGCCPSWLETPFSWCCPSMIFNPYLFYPELINCSGSLCIVYASFIMVNVKPPFFWVGPGTNLCVHSDICIKKAKHWLGVECYIILILYTWCTLISQIHIMYIIQVGTHITRSRITIYDKHDNTYNLQCILY
jgi:hypothetical protein